METRLQKIYAKLSRENLDGLIVFSAANIAYLTKVASPEAYLLVSKKGNTYFTDSRYTEEVKPRLKGIARLARISTAVSKTIASACSALKLKRIGFEEQSLSYAQYKKLAEHLPGLIPVCGAVEGLRSIKEPEELEKIKKAADITGSALEFIRGFIAPGKKEIEVAGELERFIRYNGGSGSAFDTIVASGPNSAFPHHAPGERKIKNNEPVLVDMGIDYCGYKSDLTRVYFLGKMNSLFKKVYAIVRSAQDEAIKKIRPSRGLARIDAFARQYITQKGYGGFFSHNLGHGIGLEIHEEPRLSPKSQGIIRPGMVFTVEPAVYLPGKFGVRIEDMVLVTKKGCEVLSGAP